jgi:N6-L-threonylcarbamoyladenine synthase
MKFCLGVETTCDETAVALVNRNFEVIANEISSSQLMHKKFGGVIPEIAARHHLEIILPLFENLVRNTKLTFREIDVISFSIGPGLPGALMTGLAFSKTLALYINKPFVGVNHLIAHLFATCLNKKLPSFPAIGVIASGGHSGIIYLEDFENYKLLGQTRDDAIGEAFDKIAKLLQLPYPGGPEIERLALKGKTVINFPKIVIPGSLDLSYSGLKTAVLYYLQRNKNFLAVDVAASFQKSAIEIFIEKISRACKMNKCYSLIAGGGVVNNTTFRDALKTVAKNYKLELFLPEHQYCMDNAAMVAGLGYYLYDKGRIYNLNVTAKPNLGLK